MLAQPSLLSLAASALYVIVVLASFTAAQTARNNRQQQWHGRIWSFVAVFFCLLIVSRLLGFEEILRAELRDVLRSKDMMAVRRSIQGPVIAVALILSTALAMFAAFWASKRISGRRNIAVACALGACGLMVVTIVVRTVSLHALDRFLNGPLKLNWFGDLGASLAVLLAAFMYVKIVSGKEKRKR